ncbi:DASS family sodium-coupled anion symporter [uncultured Paludibaculum sp.]|uniref:DASS family sodium-coupled anion symporter n=1 Tax=uncultured Paludibaculum sp. TaxID=1765020 RepID=UPI002AAC29D5|nr:DASS family sodium-coupled anion symporter [uncultured Paludibaculum sp.]
MASPARTGWRTVRGFLILIAIYLVVTQLLPRPQAITPNAWNLTGLFLATVAGLVIQPVAGGALVLLAITLSTLLAGMKLSDALGGYADSTVWLVMAAFFVSRALINTGLARRIALGFVRLFGRSTLGVSYALSLSDMVLATIIPSNGARSGGVILPIVRSIAELYGSTPGATANRVGAFLMAGVYQAICVTAAMFYTGQASNPLAAQMAGNLGYRITWGGWLVAGIVPGLVSLALVPWVVLRLFPPEVKHTPEAAAFAHTELVKMGPLSRNEKLLSLVFAGVCGAWVSSSWTGIDITVAALLGSLALLLTGVLQWEDIINEKAAWDIFIWYGGLLRLGRALNEQGVTEVFAKTVGARFEGLGWLSLLVIAVLICYYSHYFFASITAHMLAMYAPFLALLAHSGAPLPLAVFSLACCLNLSAGLTNYGTTPAPMFFGQGYVSMKDWWRIGFVISLCHLAVWGGVGFAWWKFLGLW